jgi:hypothetical protein
MRTIARPLTTWDLNKQAEIRQLLRWLRASDLRCSCSSRPSRGEVALNRREGGAGRCTTTDRRLTTTSPKEARNGYPRF